MLLGSGHNAVAFHTTGPEKMSPCCRINFERLKESWHKSIILLDPAGALPSITANDVVVDAIFGSGLSRQPDGFTATIIHHINSSEAVVFAIDVPSGLVCDATTQTTPRHLVVHADYTLTFSPPKLALFFPENDPFVGEWELIDIGLSPDFIGSAKVNNFMLVESEVAPILRKRNKFSHKGTFGHALIIAGSTGKMGAAILSARACLRSGPGLVTVCVPKSGVQILQTAVPEAMLAIDPGSDHCSESPAVEIYSAIGIGPGTGTAPETANALKIMLQHARTPIVFDADAINILAENKTWLGFIPKGSVFTPHPREFERLVGKSSNNFDQNRMQREFSFRYQCFVVLKGAHTAITAPNGYCYFNTTGNPGMSTGGSGDVLTGIITGLMAQGYSSLESCLLGAFVHGRAGDLAAENLGYESLVAGDIIINLGKSFQSLYGKF
jgi:NAD(P)H-hydrate epimerase